MTTTSTTHTYTPFVNARWGPTNTLTFICWACLCECEWMLPLHACYSNAFPFSHVGSLPTTKYICDFSSTLNEVRGGGATNSTHTVAVGICIQYERVYVLWYPSIHKYITTNQYWSALGRSVGLSLGLRLIWSVECVRVCVCWCECLLYNLVSFHSMWHSKICVAIGWRMAIVYVLVCMRA